MPLNEALQESDLSVFQRLQFLWKLMKKINGAAITSSLHSLPFVTNTPEGR